MPANPPLLFGDIGSVKAAVQTILTGPEFEALLVACEARFGDGLVLPRVPLEAVKTSEIVGVPASFPWVEIVGERSDPDTDTDADTNTHRISVIVWMNGDDEETVTKLCERHILAMRSLVRGETLMPMIGSLPIVRGVEEYGVTGRKPDLAHPYVKAASITFAITTIE